MNHKDYFSRKRFFSGGYRGIGIQDGFRNIESLIFNKDKKFYDNKKIKSKYLN